MRQTVKSTENKSITTMIKRQMKSAAVLMLTVMVIAGATGCKKDDADADNTSGSVTVIQVIKSDSIKALEAEMAAQNAGNARNNTKTNAAGGATGSADNAAAGTDELTIQFVNECGADIAMLSLIDPASDEQINIDALPAGGVISINANWPENVTELDWAVYNANGDLVAESVTDISAAESLVMITIKGNGDFESVEEAFE